MALDLGILTASLSPAAGGLFTSVRLPANRLVKTGASVSVYGLLDEQFENTREAWQGPDIAAFPVSGPARFGFSPAMMKEVLKADHDLLHLHGIWMYPSHVAQRWQQKTGRPIVISPRGMLDPWALDQSVMKKRIIRLLFEDRNLRNAATLHALNHDEARAFRDFGLLNPIAVIPNGVDLADLEQRVIAPPWRQGDGRKVLLFLGRLHQKKGLRELFEAWDGLATSKPLISEEWRLVIAGWDDGGHGEELEAIIKDRELQNHIELVGAVHGELKSAVLHHSDAFILPSYSEGLPMAVLEAWSYELPVFMTSACNLPKGFESESAFEISTKPDQLADVLSAILVNDALLKNAGQNGRLLVKNNYTWEKIVSDMLILYKWLLDDGEQPEFVFV